MSRGHGASRRQAYGRRMKDLRTRRATVPDVDLDGPADWNRGETWDADPAIHRTSTCTPTRRAAGRRRADGGLPGRPGPPQRRLAPRRPGIAALGTRGATRTFVRPRLIAEASIAVPRVRPAAMLVGVVLVATLIGFAYLTQTLTSTTTAVEIERLVAEQQRLKQVISARVAIIGSEAADVADRAADLGLTPSSAGPSSHRHADTPCRVARTAAGG